MTIYLGENIKKLRREKNLTQERLAEFLGVTFQSISNWERGESYPDVTFIPDIADFFNVSIEKLLGVNKAKENEKIVKALETYDNITDGDLKQNAILELKKEFPNDFRILLRYMTCLIHFKEKSPENTAKIISIYENIKQNCNNDKIRISAKRHIVEFYCELLDNGKSGITFEDCEKIIKEMPRMRDSQEMFSLLYPKDYPNRDEMVLNGIEEQLLSLNMVCSRYFSSEKRFSDEWAVSALKKEIDFYKFIYDDGHYGKLWHTVICKYGMLGLRYYKLLDNENAIESFKTMCRLANEFDNLAGTTVMHSTIFGGKIFDKHIYGNTYTAKGHVKNLLTKEYDLSDEFKSNKDFTNLMVSL